MDMESVIGHQSIQRRHSKPAFTGRQKKLPARRKPIFIKQQKALKINSPSSDSLFRAAQAIREKPARKTSPVRMPKKLHSVKSFSIESLRKFFYPLALGLGIIVMALLTVSAVSAYDPIPVSGDFILPDDRSIETALLDAISPMPIDPFAEIALPELPLSLSMGSHKVQSGETLDAISRQYGMRLDTLISVNNIQDVRRIQIGAILKIPNIDGVMHIVGKGETLSGIANARSVSVFDLADANNLLSETIQPGSTLFIPGARLASYDLKKALGTLVIWPATGRISSPYGYRPDPFTGVRSFHSGLDIVVPVNHPIKAAMDGRVAETGFSTLYGNFVILSHSNGYQTLYAHLNRILVKAGTNILQGSQLGLAGSTGYSTGVHLHFGVYKNGVAINPYNLLNQ